MPALPHHARAHPPLPTSLLALLSGIRLRSLVGPAGAAMPGYSPCPAQPCQPCQGSACSAPAPLSPAKLTAPSLHPVLSCRFLVAASARALSRRNHCTWPNLALAWTRNNLNIS